MKDRPALGRRVRVRLSNIPGERPSVGVVTGHHEDGWAVRVRLDGVLDGAPIICDPDDLEPARTHA